MKRSREPSAQQQVAPHRRHPALPRAPTSGTDHGASDRRESGANLASINYHFGSKDDLVTEAVIEGLDRWLEEVASGLGDVESQAPAERYRRAR